MATLKNLQTKIARLQAQADDIVKKQSAGVIAKIHALMHEFGLTVEDIGSETSGKKRGDKAGASAASQKTGASGAKYRDPKSGATWSGHGRAPGWIANARNRNKFLIDASASPASVADSKAAKPVGNYVRGPQPAKYRDPKTGAEWSGRGKAPAWLAVARDRTRFLIDAAKVDGAPEKASAKKTAAKKTTATKKAAKKVQVSAKKAPAKKAPSRKAPAKKAALKRSSATESAQTAAAANGGAATEAAGNQ
jgi:DNA-binding protein H-NS